MPIKFGDTLENQNTNYPIVDVVGENVAGVFIVDGFTDGNLGNIPQDARRNGSIVIDKTDGSIYIYSNTTLTDGAGLWNDADGASWNGVNGDNTLGSDSSFSDGTLQDNSPAVSGLTTSTTITSAIDQLNETLGALVPAGPQTFNSFESGDLSGFNALTGIGVFSSVAGSATRLVPLDGIGGSNLTHATNNSGNTYTPGSGSNTVAWTSSASMSNSISVSGNNLRQEVLVLTLNDATATLATPVASNANTSATLLAADNDYGGNMNVTITHASFPTTGDSAGFYNTAVSQISLSVNSTLVNGFHNLKLEDSSGNGVEYDFYRAPTGDAIGVATAAPVKSVLSDAGTNVYLSGQKHYSRPTIQISGGIIQNIVPNGALVYGATVGDTSDNTFMTFDAGDHFPAMGDVEYTDIVSSVDDIGQNWGWTMANQSVISSVSLDSGKVGMLTLAATASMPAIDLHSIHGNSDNNTMRMRNTAGGSDISTSKKFACFDKGNVATDANLINEHSLTGGLGGGNGVRVAETGDATAYTDTPDGTFNAWSEQYGNNSASDGTLSLDAQDAITVAEGTELRLRHELTDYTTSTYQFAGSAQNFSNRSSTNKQYATYEFPMTTTGQQYIYLKFQGDLDGVTDSGTNVKGTVYVKIFDDGVTGVTNSLEAANSSTNGWLDCAVAASGSPVPNSGGAATGGNLDPDSTNFQSIKLDAGNARWHQGNNKVFVRVVLPPGGYVNRLGLALS